MSDVQAGNGVDSSISSGRCEECKEHRDRRVHGIDFDGTAAFFHGNYADGVLGEPIPRMAARIRAWLLMGDEVHIFTARVNPCGGPGKVILNRQAIREWCFKHFGFDPVVTCMKDPKWYDYWDDLAVRVEHNTGRISAGNDVEDPAEGFVETADGIGEFLTERT